MAAQAVVRVEDLAEMDDYSLQDLLKWTRKSNEMISVEIEMFERFLKRVDSRDVVKRPISTNPSSPAATADVRASKKKGKTRGNAAVDKVLKLSSDQKYELASHELEQLKEEQAKRKEEFERAWDNHSAVVEEADIQLAEIKKSYYEFDRDIVRGAINPRTNKMVAEKVLHYYAERIKVMDTLVEKLRLKNSTLRVKKRKLSSQLKAKEEAGEVRNEVDFEQLKIENKQFSEKFDEKNEELLKLKLSAGNTLQILNSYKKKLHALSTESDYLNSEISQRSDLLHKIQAEATTVDKEKAKAEEVNEEARRKLEDFRVPEVMEYVRERSNVYELGKKVKAWERKVEIAEMALRSYKQTWSRVSHQNTASSRLHPSSRLLPPLRLQ